MASTWRSALKTWFFFRRSWLIDPDMFGQHVHLGGLRVCHPGPLFVSISFMLGISRLASFHLGDRIPARNQLRLVVLSHYLQGLYTCRDFFHQHECYKIDTKPYLFLSQTCVKIIQGGKTSLTRNKLPWQTSRKTTAKVGVETDKSMDFFGLGWQGFHKEFFESEEKLLTCVSSQQFFIYMCSKST